MFPQMRFGNQLLHHYIDPVSYTHLDVYKRQILYVLMGISSALVYREGGPDSKRALLLYGIQLLVNFIWPILFFRFQWYLPSFLWLVLLWVLILWMIVAFYRVRPLATYLQIPYLVWVTFAGYLNLMIYLLNP